MAWVTKLNNQHMAIKPTNQVKNLGWLLRKAGQGDIASLAVFTDHPNLDKGFVLTANTKADSKTGEYYTYFTNYADWQVFSDWLKNSRVLRGALLRVGYGPFPIPSGNYWVSAKGLGYFDRSGLVGEQ